MSSTMARPATCSLGWSGHLSTMSDMLEQLYQHHEHADVTLVCDDGHLLAHSIVLASSSTFLTTLLENVNQSPSPTSIYFANTSLLHLQALQTLLYCGQMTVTKEVLEHLLAMARQLQITGITAEPKREAIPDQYIFQDLDKFFVFEGRNAGFR